MIFDGKRLEDITEDDLQYLEDNQIIEKRQLEYKKELTIKSGDEKREFLADVSAFANSAGGYLIYGIEEDDGVPIDLLGIESASSLDARKINLVGLTKQSFEEEIKDYKKSCK
jgi:predicted HTH transcriptional regulator